MWHRQIASDLELDQLANRMQRAAAGFDVYVDADRAGRLGMRQVCHDWRGFAQIME